MPGEYNVNAKNRASGGGGAVASSAGPGGPVRVGRRRKLAGQAGWARGERPILEQIHTMRPPPYTPGVAVG